ncbi:unnamed protein product [Lactuca saligna]|uniref:F-box associated beta-propeller type 1 domain-containing protein n=1 Tax=Lactuca saligna TaxID=75948 RepID=A0AA35VKM5_LACSI|nr:unnamed protein product [Lactuca saligna]
MIIKITQFNWWYKEKSEINNPWKVKIYMMSSGKWRILSSNLLSHFELHFLQVVIDRFIYWCALHKVPIDGRLRSCNVIVSFDMTNESFGVVDLPDSLAHHPNTQLCISKVRESLVMLEYKNCVCDVWMMEDGVGKSFTKLYTIKAPHGPKKILGFKKNGKLIMEVKDGLFRPGTLVVYVRILNTLMILGFVER